MSLTQTEYTIGGGWGDAIHWHRPEEFNAPSIDGNSRFSVYGFKRDMPREGDTLKAEMQKSWMWFEFVEVEPCRDPRDMFFAKVKPVNQVYK